MPGIALHFVLAERALAQWQISGYAPCDPADPDVVNAFYHGAVGPDLGYLPGGHRPLSELAHSVRSGQLTRCLIETARTPIERAFAWGWLTHVLGDREIHPWVGRGVGELRTGCRYTFVAGGTDPLTHLRVELGVDCWYAAHHSAARAIRLRPAFDAVSIVFLERAYQRTYGLSLPRRLLLDSHRAVGRRAGQALAAMCVLGRLTGQARSPLALSVVGWLLRAAYRVRSLQGPPLAFLNPVAPARWLLEGISAAAAAHADLFTEALRSGGRDLADYDLDTGVLASTPGHAPAIGAVVEA
ncbi:MAG TPA: zinc dependent phospholipase C family protein [Longimicrobiales bacterium]|nr:zinc dependent phospholipase C family protein [Longimicrobiales bacterium]